MLEATQVTTGYNRISALSEVSLRLGAGQTLAILGPNGAGKSTLLKLIAGLLRPWTGSVQFNGEDISGLSVEERIAKGIVICPEGRRIFATLSVEENLRIGGTILLSRPGGRKLLKQRIEDSYDMFPILGERRNSPGNALSGGQQQMLAMARTLVAGPSLLLLDEPSLGLSPVMADEVYAMLERLKADGLSMIVVEEAAGRPIRLAEEVVVLRNGSKVWSGDTSAAQDPAILRCAYLGDSAA